MSAGEIIGPLITLYSILLGGFAFIIKSYNIDGWLYVIKLIAGVSLGFVVGPILLFMYTTLDGSEQNVYSFGQLEIFGSIIVLLIFSLWSLIALFIFTTD